ncbi:MAG: YceI family protein [Polyangiaceae bacterium]|nr:YceI family protein [Polyangiaceae bacterium]
MRSFRSLFVLAAVAAVSLGCENPADNKPVATVGSAKPVATATATAKATATAMATATATAAATAAPSVATIPAKAGEAVDLDPSSTFEFVGSKVTGKHSGSFSKFTGWAELAKGKVEGGKVAIEVDMSAVKSDDEKLTGHLMSPDFFDVAKYPKATFESTEIKKGGDKGATHTITGNLDFHGVKKSISFPAKVTESAKEVVAEAEFVINRKDFNIVYAGKADDLIRDEVVLKLKLKAPVKK